MLNGRRTFNSQSRVSPRAYSNTCLNTHVIFFNSNIYVIKFINICLNTHLDFLNAKVSQP